MYHNNPMIAQEASMPAHLVIQQQVGLPSSQPQPQRQRIPRDEQIADFRKFKQNFILSSSKGPRGNVSLHKINKENNSIKLII